MPGFARCCGRIKSQKGTQSSDLQILRCKGLVVTDTGDQYVLQGVRSMYDMSRVEEEVVGVPEAREACLHWERIGFRR